MSYPMLKRLVYPVSVLVLLTYTDSLWAQQAPIRGRVVNEEGEPLSNVQIEVTASVSPGPIKGRTKKNGTFTIVLPNRSWEYELRFELDGYQKLHMPIPAARVMNQVLEITLARIHRPASNTTLEARSAETSPGPLEEEMTEQRRAAVVVFNDGVTALEAGNHEGAEETFRRALEVDPTLAEAYRALIAIASEKENWESVVADARALLRLDSDDLDVHWALYFALLRVGEADSVAAAVRGLVSADPRALHERSQRRHDPGCTRGHQAPGS